MAARIAAALLMVGLLLVPSSSLAQTRTAKLIPPVVSTLPGS